ncbi:MAG TPA: fructose-bisphosphatase class II family protein [Thermoleophilaceae bacterium]|nr:fructose-bisphosphatase class II family protein [Thermoleophilaceae bacterium]
MEAVTAGESATRHKSGLLLARLEHTALAATREAAIACQEFVGSGDGKAADGAATNAMRTELAAAPGTGRVVIGEGEKDEAPMLFNGESVGEGGSLSFDIAVDPLECTSLCAAGMPGALTTIAMAETGSMWEPGPAFYMDKLLGRAEVRDAIDINDTPEANLERAAEAYGKAITDLRVVVLDKPRHEDLIARLRAAGAHVSTPPDGDVGGALQVLLPRGDADLLMGIGGTPEGVMTACAARALGGVMQGKLAPQKDDERQALEGTDLDHVLELEEMVSGEAFFVATGVTGGLVAAPRQEDGWNVTESMVVAAGSVKRVVAHTAPTDGNANDGGTDL